MEKDLSITASDFGNQIKTLRRLNKITQPTLAKAAGISRTTLWRLEKGVISTRISVESILRLLDMLGISVSVEKSTDHIIFCCNNCGYSFPLCENDVILKYTKDPEEGFVLSPCLHCGTACKATLDMKVRK